LATLYNDESNNTKPCLIKTPKPIRNAVYNPLDKPPKPSMLLHNAHDRRAVLWLVLYAGTTLLAWHSSPYLLFTPLLAYFAFATACITHNSMHCPVFCDPAHEHLWRVALTLGYGHPCQTFLSGHNLSHHRFTQTRKDPMRTSKARFRWHFLNLLLFQPLVAGDVFRQDVRFLRRSPTVDRRAYALQIFPLVLFRVWTMWLDPLRAIALCIFPCLFAQWGIVTMNLLQHDGCATPAPGERNYNMARNFVGPVVNYATFNNGYHTIHHFFPTLHWSRLPEEHVRLVRPHMLPGLDERCMARYVWRTFVRRGGRVDAQGRPVKFKSAIEAEDEDWTAEYFAEEPSDASDDAKSEASTPDGSEEFLDEVVELMLEKKEDGEEGGALSPVKGKGVKMPARSVSPEGSAPVRRVGFEAKP
tara:strand:+ start:197 stop:1441 length:1245 start_codon:yes stop_codon:yes gene_type:complete